MAKNKNCSHDGMVYLNWNEKGKETKGIALQTNDI